MEREREIMLRIFILISIDNWHFIFLCLWHGKNINIGIRGVRGRYYICQLKSQLGQQLMVATCYILLWASMTCIEWTLAGLLILHCATTCVCVCVEEILHVWETLPKKKLLTLSISWKWTNLFNCIATKSCFHGVLEVKVVVIYVT